MDRWLKAIWEVSCNTHKRTNIKLCEGGLHSLERASITKKLTISCIVPLFRRRILVLLIARYNCWWQQLARSMDVLLTFRPLSHPQRNWSLCFISCCPICRYLSFLLSGFFSFLSSLLGRRSVLVGCYEWGIPSTALFIYTCMYICMLVGGAKGVGRPREIVSEWISTRLPSLSWCWFVDGPFWSKSLQGSSV